MDAMKKCNKCGEVKTMTEFYKSTASKDGLHAHCKICAKAAHKVWSAANKERHAAYVKDWRASNKDNHAYKERVSVQQKAWREANKERHSALTKAWAEANKDRIAALNKKWREANKDNPYLRERQAAASKAWQLSNKERYAASQKAWREANPDKRRASTAKRRAMKLKATPLWADFEKIDVLYEYANLCSIVLKQKFHVDHIVPLQGKTVCGLHIPANLQVLEASKNISKSNKQWPDMW